MNTLQIHSVLEGAEDEPFIDSNGESGQDEVEFCEHNSDSEFSVSDGDNTTSEG